tara:strand:- start:444 stop:617 length:174 start_codon:yes stop_codon:yes gene_type:complete
VTAIPFDDWLRLSVRIGIAPAAFWGLSLKEWRALTTSGGPEPLRRAELDALRAKFPD